METKEGSTQLAALQGRLLAVLHYVFETCDLSEAQPIADATMSCIFQVCANDYTVHTCTRAHFTAR